MKTINYVLLLAFILTFGSCATKVKFPVSPLAPAAEGTVKVNQDKNKNYVINLSVKYLANPDRLNPPKQYYVIWLENENGNAVNLGMLVSDNKNNASFKSVTSSKPALIFITAEDTGDVNYPGSQEIFRTENLNLK